MVRILLLADTHLGFDLPLRTLKVQRPRRGEDFFANTRRALEPARTRAVDAVVHGGDLLFRSKVPAHLVERALEPLLEVADVGAPVILVPGNHERGAVPFPLLAAHRHLHVMDRPRTVRLELAGLSVAFSGFPCERERIATRFPTLVRETGWQSQPADIRVLCLHQTVEGATVGPSGYTFRHGHDIIPGRLIPTGLAAVLAGHIHRHQLLEHDLSGQPLAAPVLYPGSVERTSFAEKNEVKGYLIVQLETGEEGGRVAEWCHHPLPTRPMEVVTVDASGRDRRRLRAAIREKLADLDPAAVVQLRVEGPVTPEARPALGAVAIRETAPATMIVQLQERADPELTRS
jgi:DNA repair exonuclease SbcCD nuclease subunit